MAEQVVRMLIGLFVSVWIARHLGPTQFGQLSFAISFASLFGIFSTLGLSRIVVRELVKNIGNPSYATELINTVVGVRMCAALCMFLLCVIASWLADQGDIILVGIISAGFFFSAFDCIELFFQSRTEARVTVLARMLAFFIITAVKIILLIAGARLVDFALVMLAEFTLASLALWLAYRWRGFKIQCFEIDWKLAAKLVGESWPEIIAGFSVMLFMRIDQVMLQNLIGSEAVGIFSVAARLSEAWYFVPIALVASTFPSIVRQREIDRGNYLLRLQQLMSGLVALAYLAIFVTNFLAGPVILILYGEVYRQSAHVLVVHIWCGLLVSLGISSGSWIMAEKKVKLNLCRALVGAVVNISLNLFCIPRYGVVGAAYSTLFSLVAAYFLFDFFVPEMRCMAKSKINALLVFPAFIRSN